MPWLVGVDEADKDKMEDIVDRILNNEVVVFADLQSLGKVQTLATNTPYIIDKLVEYKRGLEQELMTILGVDNNGSASLEQTHVSVDAVNANNDVINDYANAIESEINKGLRDIKEVSCCSGDQFIEKREDKIERFEAGCQICDMEIAAIARICSLNEVKCLSIKCISDAFDGDGSDFNSNVREASDKAFRLIDEILRKL